MLNMSWETQPNGRPSIEVVLECLERVSRAWEPPSQQVDEDLEMDQDDWNIAVELTLLVCFHASIPPHPCSCGGSRADQVSDPLSERTPLDLARNRDDFRGQSQGAR